MSYPRYELNRFDNERAKNKEKIEYTWYMLSRRVLSSGLVITGTNVKRHIDNFFGCVGRGLRHHMLIVEKNRPYYDKLMSNFDELLSGNGSRHYKNLDIRIQLIDISEFGTSYRFEDIDLCSSWKNDGAVIKDRLARQSFIHQDTDKLKGFIFTVSRRSIYSDFDNLKELIAIVGAELVGFDGRDGDLAGRRGFDVAATKEYSMKDGGYCTASAYINEPILGERGRVEDFLISTYKDGGPMLTGLILYR